MGGGERFAPWMAYCAGRFYCGGPHMGAVVSLKTAAGWVPESSVHRSYIVGVSIAMAFITLKRSLDPALRQTQCDQYHPNSNHDRTTSQVVHKHLSRKASFRAASYFLFLYNYFS